MTRLDAPLLAPPPDRGPAVTAAGQEGSRCEAGAVPATVSASMAVVRHLPWSVVRFSGRDQPWSVGAEHPPRRQVRHEEDEMIDALPTTEIVITAERAPEEAADTPASVTVIDGQQHRAARRAAATLFVAADPFGRRGHFRSRRLADRGPHPGRGEQPHPAVHRRHPRQRSSNRKPAQVRSPELRRRVAGGNRPRPAIGALGLGGRWRRHRDRRRGRRQ